MYEKIKTCPYLGLAEDPTTNTAFPSSLNHCHRAKPLRVVEFGHQQNVCLALAHINCPVFLREGRGGLPSELRAPGEQTGQQKRVSWLTILMIAVVLAALVFAGYSLFAQAPIIPLTGTVVTGTLPILTDEDSPSATDSATLTPTTIPSLTVTRTANPMTLTAAEKNAFNETALATLSVTFTATPSATATATWTVSPSPSMTPSRTATHTQTPSRTPTRTMTRTPTPKVFTRSLDMPIGREKKFIIHRVGLGENLQQYAEVHRTSADAIIRVNYSLFVPLWVDALVVIPVGFTDVEMIPYFEPYQVQANNLSLETLAGELGTNLQDFKFYNNFKEGEMVYRGDWVLVPRLKNAAGQLYFND